MLNPRWRKVIRDLWSNKTRTVLVVLAIAVGVFAFGSVFITQKVFIADMTAQYRASNAAAIIMNIDSFDDDLVRWARRQEEVVAAQGRAVYPVKLIEENKTHILDLYAYGDYENILLHRINVETGTWPPGRHDIFFERTSLPVAGTEIGDSIVIELSSGREYELKVAGTVHDTNAIPANLDPRLTGYVSMQTLRGLDLPDTYNRLEILPRPEFNSLVKLEKVADEIKEELKLNGVSVDFVTVREPDEHWARENAQTFTLILSIIGIFSLILSGFLVVNTVSALLAEQRRQIGIMKAIGARGRQIVGVYLVMVAFYGLLSLVVALPVSMGLGYLFVLALTQFLNIDILNFYLPGEVFLLQLATALLVPLVASAIPILGGVRVTVREAISSYGIGSKGGYGLFDRLLLRVRGLSRPALLSLRNTFRRKGRLLLTLGTLVIAGALFVTVVNARSSMMAWQDDLFDMWFNYEVELFFDDDYHSQGVVQRAERMPGVTKAEGRTGAQVQHIKPDGTKGATFPLIGLPPDTDFIQPDLLSGRWLQEKDRAAIVLGSNLAEDMPDVQIGDEIVLEMSGEEYDWEVVGTVFMPFERISYAHFDYLSSVKGEPGLASSMYVRTEEKDGPAQARMAEALEKRLKDLGIKISQSMTSDEVSSSIAGQLDFIVAFLLAMAAMTAVIGGLGLAGMMGLNVMERTREIGVMRSIGATNARISSLVVTEGLLIGAISWALALPLSVPMSLAFNTMLGEAFFSQPLDFVFSPLGVIIWLAIIVFVSIVASLLPAYRASKMSVMETLAYE
jgi:putative ABC transport system permease protein